MEACTRCEQSLRPSSLELTVTRSGTDVLVYAANRGMNILILKRMVLCLEGSGGSMSLLYIREGGYFDYYVGGERLEQGLTHLKFRTSAGSAQSARVRAEYFEVTGRSLSCEAELAE